MLETGCVRFVCVCACKGVAVPTPPSQPLWQGWAVGAYSMPSAQFAEPALAGSEPLANKKFTSLNDTHPTCILEPPGSPRWGDVWKRRGLTEPPLLQKVTSQSLPPWRVGPAWQKSRSLKKRGLRHLQVGCMVEVGGLLAFLGERKWVGHVEQ